MKYFDAEASFGSVRHLYASVVWMYDKSSETILTVKCYELVYRKIERPLIWFVRPSMGRLHLKTIIM